jgi:ubiquinone/menaquinone biosynthesis C-methylase UbiE
VAGGTRRRRLVTSRHVSARTRTTTTHPEEGTIMSATQLDHAEVMTALRVKQQQVWSSGDYNRIAALTVGVNETLVSTAEIRPGETVLDVATGTGHAALAAARTGARVTGIDYVPELLDVARGRAAAERLDVSFVEAPAEQLPFVEGSFDVVISAIGVMFAADHDRAAGELARVARAGGRIALAAWTRSGFVGGILGIVGKHVPPPPGAQSPVRWGEEDVVAELLGERVADVQSSLHVVTQRFTSAEAFADLFLTYYGPTRAASMRLDEEGRTALRAELVTLAEANDRGHGTGAGVVLDWEYRIVTATRR